MDQNKVSQLKQTKFGTEGPSPVLILFYFLDYLSYDSYCKFNNGWLTYEIHAYVKIIKIKISGFWNRN